MMTWIRKALTACCCMLVLTACWSRYELNELAITSATAVDREGEDWLASFQVILPSSISTGIGITGSASGSPIIVYSTKGKSIMEADQKSFLESPRKLYFAHNRVMIISEETARRGLNPIFDLYLRTPESRETVTVMITRGSARRLLEQMMQIEKIPAAGIEGMIRMETQNISMLRNMKLYQLAMKLTSESASSLVPEIELSGSEEVTSMKVFEKTTLPSKIRLGSSAVMKKDKMVGWMSRRESLGVSFITDQVNRTVLTVGCPNSPSSSANSTVLINKSSTKLVPSVQKDKLTIQVNIKAKGTLAQSECKTHNLYDPTAIKQLEKELEKEINAIAKEGWESAKKLKADVVGFAELVHRKLPDKWHSWEQDWDTTFADIQVNVNSKVNLTNVGLSNKSIDVNHIRDVIK